MTHLSKRALLSIAGWSTIAATAALVGCGKKADDTAAAPAPAEPASAAAAAPAKPEPLKVAFVYVGNIGDGGWTFAHDNARKELEREFGDRITTSYVESVPEGADAERVFRDQAQQGAKLIFGT
ncbi:MAG: BMP family ABC transporter substrate-binding protein, partial [Rhizobacter sp.]